MKTLTLTGNNAIENIRAAQNQLLWQGHPSINEQRELALESLCDLVYPSTRDEEWKYSDPSSLLTAEYEYPDTHARKPSKKVLSAYVFKEKYHLLVFVNGVYSPSLSDNELQEKGVQIVPLSLVEGEMAARTVKILNKKELSPGYFSAINTSLISDGAFIYIPKHVVIEREIQILYLNTSSINTLQNVRNIYLLEDGARASIIESYHSLTASKYFLNVQSYFELAGNSVLEHIRIQNDSGKADHVSRTDIEQGRSSVLTAYNITLGGNFVRNDVNVRLQEENAETNLMGLYVCSENQHVDNHTRIDHLVPHCGSNELYKGVLSGSSRGVFNGKVYVHKDAQKTNAFQQNKNLILNASARVDTKPQLEIFADDVKCTHGATIGRLDDEALFYLRSRGFSKELAKKLLVYAFADDVVKNIGHLQVRTKLEELIHGKLEERLTTQEVNG